MLDLRPVGYVIGLLVAALAAAMLVPFLLDVALGDPRSMAFAASAAITGVTGALLALATAGSAHQGLTLQQSFLLTAGVWLILPAFGALPFLLGDEPCSVTDAYFEAVSGITTTGASVLTGLDDMSRGLLLWRGILQWLGGLGIVVVAMVFLPVMKVGGMQFFKTEGFDTLGKILPRALDIARSLLTFYILLTLACISAYALFGMTALDAVIHAFATVSTGGFAGSDSSFGRFTGALEYVASLFMLVSAMPFIRFLQLFSGTPGPLWRDPQVRAFLRWTSYGVISILIYRLFTSDLALPDLVRETLFNTVSIYSGTGFGSANVQGWGGFPLMVLFMLGVIGGCTASSSGGISVFRFVVLFQAIRAQVAQMHSPRRIVRLRYGERVIEEDVVGPVMVFFSLYITTLILFSVLATMTGLDIETSVFAIWTSIGNVGFAFGPGVQRTGTMVDFPDFVKWLMIASMLLGRLGLVPFFVLLVPRFWRG